MVDVDEFHRGNEKHIRELEKCECKESVRSSISGCQSANDPHRAHNENDDRRQINLKRIEEPVTAQDELQSKRDANAMQKNPRRSFR